MNIEESTGYKKLVAALEQSERDWKGQHRYKDKFDWIIARANHYAEKTGIPASDILDAWEAKRDYWFMNYYQESAQPVIADGRVRVFDTVEALLESIGKAGFRCPRCAQVSQSPYECSVKPCDWKVYGLFGHMGKGVSVFVKEKVAGEALFMPIAWEASPETGGVS